MSDSFVREDRQQVVGLPDADADTFLAGFDEWFNIEDGHPGFYLAGIVAVRGERLVLGRIAVEYTGSPAGEALMILQFDDQINLAEKMIAFDLTDIDSAIAELDAMHNALSS